MTDNVLAVLSLLQITDIHFSVVNNFSVADALQSFCHNVIGSIKPSLVIVSGDLTHAKFADERNSQQFSAEWKAYNSIVHKCNVKDIPWLDIRGNHGMLFVVVMIPISECCFFR